MHRSYSQSQEIDCLCFDFSSGDISLNRYKSANFKPLVQSKQTSNFLKNEHKQNLVQKYPTKKSLKRISTDQSFKQERNNMDLKKSQKKQVEVPTRAVFRQEIRNKPIEVQKKCNKKQKQKKQTQLDQQLPYQIKQQIYNINLFNLPNQISTDRLIQKLQKAEKKKKTNNRQLDNINQHVKNNQIYEEPTKFEVKNAKKSNFFSNNTLRDQQHGLENINVPKIKIKKKNSLVERLQNDQNSNKHMFQKKYTRFQQHNINTKYDYNLKNTINQMQVESQPKTTKRNPINRVSIVQKLLQKAQKNALILGQNKNSPLESVKDRKRVSSKLESFNNLKKILFMRQTESVQSISELSSQQSQVIQKGRNTWAPDNNRNLPVKKIISNSNTRQSFNSIYRNSKMLQAYKIQ